MGWTFCRNQKTYAWYGEFLGDYAGQDAAFRAEMKPDDYGKCQHAIKVPGASYEIGLVQKGSKFVPVWDNWSAGGLQNIQAENGMGGFMQAYALEKAKLEARRKGLPCTEKVLGDGRIELTIHDRR